ncbi:MAG: Dps family protein [Rickettsiales bacterium]
MSNNPVAEELKILLADSYALYLKTQNYHWNVEGENFKALHLMFEEQYTDLAAAIDEIAERIRALGHKAPGSWKSYAEVSNIKDGDEDKDAKSMVKELAEDQKIISSTLNQLIKTAQKAGDEVTIGLAVDRLTVHEKAGWMLSASV